MKKLFILLIPLVICVLIKCRDVEQKNKDEESIARVIRTDAEDAQARLVRNKIIRVGRGKFKTIASIYPISPNTTVLIGAGTYNEQLILVSDVTFQLEAGAIIDYSSPVSGPSAVTDNGIDINNCVLQGFGIIRRTGGRGDGVSVDGNSTVYISGVTIQSADFDYGIHVTNGNVDINLNMHTFGPCIKTDGGTVTINGNFISDRDYTIWIGDGVVNLKGNIEAFNNSAVGVYGGYLTFEGYALSHYLFGFEMGGGLDVKINNSIIESRRMSGKEEGDALSKYGGIKLALDNSTFTCASNTAYSLSEQGRADSIRLVSDCYANRPKTDLITLVGPGNLIVN